VFASRLPWPRPRLLATKHLLSPMSTRRRLDIAAPQDMIGLISLAGQCHEALEIVRTEKDRARLRLATATDRGPAQSARLPVVVGSARCRRQRCSPRVTRKTKSCCWKAPPRARSTRPSPIRLADGTVSRWRPAASHTAGATHGARPDGGESPYALRTSRCGRNRPRLVSLRERPRASRLRFRKMRR